MAGVDARDSTSVDAPVDDYLAALDTPLKGLRIGIVREFMGEGLDDACAAAVRAALAELEALGATLTEISLPNIGLSVPTYYLNDLYCRSRGEGFGAEVKRRIMTGTYVLSAGYYDAYYLQAQKVRRLISADFERAFESVDLVAGPTTPTPAFGLGEKTDDPITMYLNDIYTIGANLAGLPAMSVPCGLVDGLPVGLQLVAPAFGEGRMLSAAHGFQRATDWHTKAPEGWS